MLMFVEFYGGSVTFGWPTGAREHHLTVSGFWGRQVWQRSAGKLDGMQAIGTTFGSSGIRSAIMVSK